MNNKIRNTDVYIVEFDFVNSLSCVTGQETKCEVKPYNLANDKSINLNSSDEPNPVGVDWLSVNSLTYNTYDKGGNYSESGSVKFVDQGPENIDNIIKDMSVLLEKSNSQRRK